MALGNHQKITRVVTGRPFGDGSDGAYSSATIPTMTKQSCSGASGQKDLTIASGAFANGDIVLIHQTRGTGVGQWEINKISSGGGTTTLTMQLNLQYTYTDSAASQAQVTKIPQYTTATVQSGTWTLTDWGGNTGGILVLAAKTSLTITGSINGNGKGYRGGAGSSQGSPKTANSGEGTSAASSATSDRSDNAGGAGSLSASGDAGGGGGAHGAAGANGTKTGGTAGVGGETEGSADLTTMVLGGGGGSGQSDDSSSGNAGDGGGLILLISKSITVDGSVVSNGNNGSGAGQAGSGGGAGGAVLLVCGSATLGSSKITCSAGSGGNATGSADGGNGGVGRVAVHYSGSVTGTTSPSYSDNADDTLIETDGAFLFNLV